MTTLTLCPPLSSALADGGFTYDPRTGSVVQVDSVDGYAVAVPGTARVLGEDFSTELFHDAVSDALESVGDHYGDDVLVSGWHSPRHGYMLELVTVHNVDRRTAELLGIIRYQDAITDLRTASRIHVYP